MLIEGFLYALNRHSVLIIHLVGEYQNRDTLYPSIRDDLVKSLPAI